MNEQASGIEISDLVTDEQEGEIVDEQSETENQQRTSRAQQSEQILSAFAEQTSSSLSETFDHEDHLQGTNSLPTAKRSFQGIEEDEDEELSEHTTEQYHGKDGNEKVHRRSKNIYKDKNEGGDVNHVALESQGDFQPAPSESQKWMENLEFILDIPLQIDIQLGQTKIPLKEVLELSSGSLIKLNKSESAPVELLINGKLVAEGQIVVTEGNTLGVQVTSIVNRVERIRSLK